MSTRLDTLRAMDQMTAATTSQQVFSTLCGYLVEYDPSMVLALNTVTARITASAVAITVPSTVLVQAQLSGGRDAYPYDPTTI